MSSRPDKHHQFCCWGPITKKSTGGPNRPKPARPGSIVRPSIYCCVIIYYERLKWTDDPYWKTTRFAFRSRNWIRWRQVRHFSCALLRRTMTGAWVSMEISGFREELCNGLCLRFLSNGSSRCTFLGGYWAFFMTVLFFSVWLFRAKQERNLRMCKGYRNIWKLKKYVIFQCDRFLENIFEKFVSKSRILLMQIFFVRRNF